MPIDHVLSDSLDEVARQGFEAAWCAGRPKPIESFLPSPDHPHYLATLEELVLIDMEFAWNPPEGPPSPHPPFVEAYLKRFPRLQQRPVVLRLLEHECRMRQQRGHNPGRSEYRARFPHLVTRGWDIPEMDGDGQTAWPVRASSAPNAWSIARYELLAELGRGGMGVVYRALDRKHGEVVALKTLQLTDPAALYRFKQEFLALADVAHPNLVPLYDLHAEGPTWFFTMQLVEGVDFLSYVKASGPIGDYLIADGGGSKAGSSRSTRVVPIAPAAPGAGELQPGAAWSLNSCWRPFVLPAADSHRLRDSLRQLADGVSALHRAGKLHRDIKPHNVLVTAGGRVMLLDFGLVAQLDGKEQFQSTHPQLAGTVPYMAPEQMNCRPVSPASDWYSVGVLLYQALAGKLPFTGTFFEVLAAKQQFNPPSPAAFLPGIPDDLAALCLDLLRPCPANRPTGRDVLGRLRRGPTDPLPALPRPEPPLLGRVRHLERLTAAFEATRQGRPVVVGVHGQSGIGKTALVQHFLRGLSERNEAVVLAGRCYERVSMPYKALDSVVDALTRYLQRLPQREVQLLLPRHIRQLARVFPMLQRVHAVAEASAHPAGVSDLPEVRRRAFAALRELLARIGDRRPLVLAIDDLQWGDVDSAKLLADLLQPPDPPVVLVIGSYRSGDSCTSPFLRSFLPALNRIASAVNRHELAIEPLAPPAARDLAVALLGQLEPSAQVHAEAIARESGGNPFFLLELVHSVRPGTEPAGATGFPGRLNLDQVLLERIGQLPENARRLLEVVAVSGWPIREAEAYAAAEVVPQDREALTLLRSRRLVRSTALTEEEEIEIYHDRIRETVVAQLGAATLTKYHSRLALALEASGRADADVLALHFLGGHHLDRARDYYTRAADQAAEALAFDRAAKLYRLVLDLEPAEPAVIHVLQVKRGDALANAGRSAKSAEIYLLAAQDAPAEEALELRRRAALQFLISGRIDQGLAVLNTVLAAVDMKLPAPRQSLWALLWRRAQLRLRGLGFRPCTAHPLPSGRLTRIDICWSVAAGLSVVDTIRGAYFQTRGLLLALQAGEPYRIARALAVEAGHVSTGGGRTRDRTARLLQAAERLAEQIQRPDLQAVVLTAKGIAAAFEGRWRNCCENCDQAASIFRDACTGVTWELDTAQRFTLWARMFMGEAVEISNRLPLLLKEAKERDDLYGLVNLSTVILPFVRLMADEPAQARQDVAEVMQRWTQQGFHVQHMNRLFDETQIDLYLGDGLGAWKRLAHRWTALAGSHLLRVQQVLIFMLHLRARSALAAATSAADPRPFYRFALADAQRLHQQGMAWAEPLAQLIESGLASARGDTARALTLLERAVAQFDSVEMGLYAAVARRRQARLLGGDAGAALLKASNSWMMGQQVQNPARITAMLAPGFDMDP